MGNPPNTDSDQVTFVKPNQKIMDLHPSIF